MQAKKLTDLQCYASELINFFFFTESYSINVPTRSEISSFKYTNVHALLPVFFSSSKLFIIIYSPHCFHSRRLEKTWIFSRKCSIENSRKKFYFFLHLLLMMKSIIVCFPFTRLSHKSPFFSCVCRLFFQLKTFTLGNLNVFFCKMWKMMKT